MSAEERTLRVALLGCGQIADAHLQTIAYLPGAQVEAVCDLHQDLADQAAARFHIARTYTDHQKLIAEVQPDVVHITTPAQTHMRLAIDLLERGCHVYVEKPLSLNASEGEQMIAAAEANGRLLCMGHDQLFDPAWRECRMRIESGEIGTVRHVESVLGYPLAGPFGSQVIADERHWVRRLPGGLFQNTISHPLYRITDLLPDAEPEIEARWFQRAGRSFPTELRAQLYGDTVTAALVFDTAIAPQRITRVYGSRGCLEADLDAQTVRGLHGPRLPGALGRLETPWKQWRQAARSLRRNAGRFLRGELHYFAGLRELLMAFYDSIRRGAPPPIPGAEMLRVTRIMDRIFECCAERASREHRSRVETGGSRAQPFQRSGSPQPTASPV